MSNLFAEIEWLYISRVLTLFFHENCSSNEKGVNFLVEKMGPQTSLKTVYWKCYLAEIRCRTPQEKQENFHWAGQLVRCSGTCCAARPSGSLTDRMEKISSYASFSSRNSTGSSIKKISRNCEFHAV